MKIILVEDESTLLRNLEVLLSWEPGMEVVGSFRSISGVIDAVSSKKPDLLLTDINLFGDSGIDLIREARKLFPDLHILAYTSFDDKDTILKAISAGANGYLLKDSSSAELIKAIHEVSRGGSPLTPKVTTTILAELRGSSDNTEDNITPREKEVLQQLELGKSYEDISKICSISINTVHTHIKNMYKKLDAKNREELLQKARRRGIL